MNNPPSIAADDAPTLWWEATAEGTNVPVALVRIERVRAEQDEPTAASADTALREQARFTAGVEYIARAFGAAQPLTWKGGGTTLLLGGGAAEDLPARAYLAAKELWERSRIDLNLPVRIGAHVGRIQRGADPETIASDDVDLCEHLAAAAPSGTILLSEDVVLALRDQERRDMAPLGMTVGDGEPAWVFPAGAALHEEQMAFAPGGDRALWDAFRRYALGPDVRMLRYVGFRLQKNEPPSLDIRDVFVPPQAELQVRREAKAEERVYGRPLPTNRGVQDLTGPMAIRALLARYPSAVILGDPGSGKTTLIRWLAVTAASGRFLLGAQLGVHERLLPLPVSVGLLAEVRRSFPDGAVEVPAALARYFHDRGVGDEREIEAFLVRTLRAERCFVLLDGLDEIRAEERTSTHDWLESFRARYAKNRFVATSRLVGFTGSSMPDAAQIMLRPFDDAQVERYVRAFSQAYARWELGGDDAGRGEADAERLLGSLRDNGRLIAIATNPFMLSALALVHRAEGRLPRHRVQAYELFARALCETWADARRLVAQGPIGVTIAYEEEALPILGELAIAMHQRYPTGVAPKAFVVEVLAKALEARRDVSGEEAERAANAFLERAGREVQILLERGAGEWGFLHLTFQEFFAAAGLHALERFEEEAFAHLFDPRWEEVLRLGVGYLALVQKRPEAARRFVQKVLEYEAPEPERWITSVLKKQVPLAALLAAEAGDALPVAMQRRVAEALAEWVCDPPSSERAQECLQELAPYDFQGALGDALLRKLDEAPGHEDIILDAIKNIRYSAATEVLVRKLAMAGEYVGREIASVIKEIAPSVHLLAMTLLNSEFAVERAAAIRMLGAEYPDLIVQSISDKDNLVRKAAAESLFEVYEKNPSRGDLARLLDARSDDCETLRAAVAYALGKFGKNEEGVRALLELYRHDTSLRVRTEAASSLVSVTPEAMFEVMTGKDFGVRLEVISDIDRSISAPFRTRLFAMMKSQDPNVRGGAAMMLGHIFKDDAVLNALVVALKDPVSEVRQQALWSIASMESEESGMVTLNEAVRSILVDALSDDDIEVKSVAVSLLEERAWPEAIDALLVAANSESVELRRGSLLALEHYVDGRAHAALTVAMRDADASIRSSAIRVCGERGREAMSASLLNALDDSDASVREVAVSVLGVQLGIAAIPHLLRALPSTPAAREALWKIAERLHQPASPAAS